MKLNRSTKQLYYTTIFICRNKAKHVEIPVLQLNEKRVSMFIKIFYSFTNGKYNSNFVWKAKKVKLFFPSKHKNLHLACDIYQRLCSCGKDVRETKTYL